MLRSIGERRCGRYVLYIVLHNIILHNTRIYSSLQIRGMGTQGSVGEKFNKILARMVVKSKKPPSCVRVALITQRKEDEAGQREVMRSIEKMKKNIKSLSAQFDIRVKATLDSSKSVYDKSTELE